MARHLSYANVVATLALFIALGGGAYAAIKLPRNSVTTTQVKNGSLLAKDFKKGQLKAGKTGAQGPQGERGPAGAAGARGGDGAAGQNGTNGTNGTNGRDGSARAYAYVTSQGAVAPGSFGITTANIQKKTFGQYCIVGLPFAPRVAIVQPDILSNNGTDDYVAEVQTPSDGTNACANGDEQVYVRIAAETVTGGNIIRTGQDHGFYIEIN
jgi:hypothetical protein